MKYLQDQSMAFIVFGVRNHGAGSSKDTAKREGLMRSVEPQVMPIKRHYAPAVILPGHAIHHDGRWYGGFRGEEHIYELQVEAAVNLKNRLGDRCILIFSGARTRPGIPELESISEAAGVLDFTKKKYGDVDGLLGEHWARDTFENVEFSICAFFKEYGHWPNPCHLFSYPFKANRAYLIALGTLFEFFRNDILDANDFFSNKNRLPKSPLCWNQYGGNLGGPIRKDRLFFFFKLPCNWRTDASC